MAFQINPRAQLIANCKFLYGAQTEVLTLYHDNSHHALVIKHHRHTASITVFLRTNLIASSTTKAILQLLRATEIETAKLLFAGESSLFSGDPLQIMTIAHRARSFSSDCDAAQSEDFELIATPQSSSPDTTVTETVKPQENHQDKPEIEAGESYISNRPGIEEYSLPEPELEALGKGVFEEVAVDDNLAWGSCSPMIAEEVVDDNIILGSFSHVIEEVVDDKIEEEVVDDKIEEEVVDGKIEEEVFGDKIEEVVADDKIEEVVDDNYERGTSSKKNEKKKGVAWIEEPEAEPESRVIVDDDFKWSFSSKNDKKKGVMWMEELEAEPESRVIVDDDHEWGFSSKKDKKKKKLTAIEESEPVLEPEPTPEPEIVVEEYDAWGFLPTNKKKKNLLEAIEESKLGLEPEPASEPKVIVDEDDGWGFSSKEKKNKGLEDLEQLEAELVAEIPADNRMGRRVPLSNKDKKKKSVVVEELIPDPEPEVMADDDREWGDFSSKKEEKKKKKENLAVWDTPKDEKSIIEAGYSTIEPSLDVEVSSHPARQPEPEESNPSIQPELEFPENGLTITTMQQCPPPVPECGHTVILKILRSSKSSGQPLLVMATLVDNTLAAIFDAVNLFLDCETQVPGRKVQRKLEVVCGAGKSGDLKLSGLKESQWPVYLGYFAECTRCPELTVAVSDDWQ